VPEVCLHLSVTPCTAKKLWDFCLFLPTDLTDNTQRYGFISVSCGGVILSPLGTSATVWLLYQTRMIDDDECEAVGGMRIGRGNRSTQRKPAPAPLCPPQIPHNLTWARTRAATVGSRRLTAWAIAQLRYGIYSTNLPICKVTSTVEFMSEYCARGFECEVFYLFTVYLTTLVVAQTTMVRWLLWIMNREWRRSAKSGYYLRICPMAICTCT
jgi:hypothetical protein